MKQSLISSSLCFERFVMNLSLKEKFSNHLLSLVALDFARLVV